MHVQSTRCTNYLHYVSNIPQEKEKKRKEKSGKYPLQCVPPRTVAIGNLPAIFSYTTRYDCLDDYTVQACYKNTNPRFQGLASIVNHACYGNMRIVDLARPRPYSCGELLQDVIREWGWRRRRYSPGNNSKKKLK